MADSKEGADFLQPPDDIATLYTWANLYGAKYRDFSASRRQARAQSREKNQLEKTASEATAPVDSAAIEQESGVSKSASTAAIAAPVKSSVEGAVSEMAKGPVLAESKPVTSSVVTFRDPDTREMPSWSYIEETSSPAPRPNQRGASAKPLKESQKGSGESFGSRWHALKDILGNAGGMPDLFAKRGQNQVSPVLAVFSLSGGVGKTSLLAALGRALTRGGESVLLMDTAPYGLLPFYFGARNQRPGVVRNFTYTGNRSSTSIRLVSIGAEELSSADESGKEIAEKLRNYAPDADRVLVDLATASKSITNSILRLSPTILVPVIPDMSSVMTLGAIEFFFRRHQSTTGEVVKRYYLLNQFDASFSLHVEVREALSHQLGERLLPFSLRHDSVVSEALAEGMTVVDYAPHSVAAEDIATLSEWLRVISPVEVSDQETCWSEQ